MTIHIHADIPETKCFVKESFLYDGDKAKLSWIPCKVYAISSYVDSAPTFKILLENGSLFDYIPIHALTTDIAKALSKNQFDLSHLCYFNCKDDEIVVNIHEALKDKTVFCYIKALSKWVSGRYICTVDWFRGNENCHLANLENGQFILVPNHKCLINTNSQNLNPYKKITNKWKI